jgi:Rha family phage regulatory protein
LRRKDISAKGRRQNEWRVLNFQPIEENILQPHSGGIRTDLAYLLTRDAFTLFFMGFAGKRALAWKLQYIEAFNRMETALPSGNDRGIPLPGRPTT